MRANGGSMQSKVVRIRIGRRRTGRREPADVWRTWRILGLSRWRDGWITESGDFRPHLQNLSAARTRNASRPSTHWVFASAFASLTLQNLINGRDLASPGLDDRHVGFALVREGTVNLLLMDDVIWRQVVFV